MDIFNVLGEGVGVLISGVLLVVQIWLISAATRRVLGVRVGGVRTVAVSVLTVVILLQIVNQAVRTGAFGIDPATHGGVMLLVLAVLILWGFALATTVLVVMEIILPTGSLPPVRDVVFGWRRRWRRGRRYAQIMAIAAKNGLGAQIRGFRAPADAAGEPHTAVSLRRALNEAGVTFIKLGQMLSTRADLLPDAYVRELARLQNTADPEPWESVEAVLAAELGKPLEDVFDSINHRPLASASVAQVHEALLRDGSDVVVKVQRAGAARQVGQDLEILRRITTSLERNASWARRMGVRGLAEGFAASLREELDYNVERANMRDLKASLDRRGVRIPEVWDAVSSSRVIVMERFDGIPLTQAAPAVQELSGDQRRATATTLLKAVLAQIINDGIFHADLHAGNVVIWPDGEIGLLDFGSVGRLDAVSRRNLGMLLWAVDADDPATATDALLELLDRPEDLDERSLQRSIGLLLTRFRGGLGSSGGMAVFSEVFDLVVEHGLSMPPQIAAALRSLGALEGTLRILDPGLDLLEGARAIGREAMGDISTERVKREFTVRAMRAMPLVEHLPRRINKITEDLETGRFSAHFRILSHPDDRRFLAGLVQQLVVAVLAGAAVLGAISLVTSQSGPMIAPGITLFTLLGYLLGFAGFMLALRAVAMVFGRGE